MVQENRRKANERADNAYNERTECEPEIPATLPLLIDSILDEVDPRNRQTARSSKLVIVPEFGIALRFRDSMSSSLLAPIDSLQPINLVLVWFAHRSPFSTQVLSLFVI